MDSGTISPLWYQARTTGAWRRMHVYLPPSWDPGRRYPTLYLLPGGDDDDTSWTVSGLAGWILDGEIGAGMAEPMVVVMPDGRVGTDPHGSVVADPMAAELVDDVVPAIEARYPVLRGPADRALAGVSLGGVQVLCTMLTRPGVFGAYGVWSAGLLPGMLADLAARHPQLLVLPPAYLELRVGTEDAFARSATEETRALFDRFGVGYHLRRTAGGHTWRLWRDHLSDFLPALFRTRPVTAAHD